MPVEIAAAHPHLTGGGFDLPPLETGFTKYVATHGLNDRLKFYPGNFRSEPLPSADVLIMSRILHNWDIETRKMLLQKACAALPEDGALIIIESFIDDERRSNVTALLASLNMLI